MSAREDRRVLHFSNLKSCEAAHSVHSSVKMRDRQKEQESWRAGSSGVSSEGRTR